MFKMLVLFLMFCATLVYGINRNEIYFYSSYFDSNQIVIQNELKKLGDSEQDKIKKGILYLSLAVQNVPAASKEAYNIFKEFEKKEVDDLFLAYIAMNYALLSRDDQNPIKKMSYADKSIKLFNQIIEKNKNDWYMRYLRANTFIGFPDFFNVKNIAEQDFNFIIDSYESKKEKIHLSIILTTYYYLGEIKKSKDEIDKAIKYWKKAVRIGDENKIFNENYKKAKGRIKLFEE